MQIKTIIIRIFIYIFRQVSNFSKFLFRKLSFLGKGILLLGRFCFNYILFPIYKLFYLIKYKSLNIYAPAKSKVFYFLNKSYFIHIIVVVLGVGIVFTNIRAQELREEHYGENTIIYSIIAKEEYEELTEEKQVYHSSDRVLSYLDLTGSVESQKALEPERQQQKEALTDLSSVTEGGAAIVKPNILESIPSEEVTEYQNQKRKESINYVVKPGETVTHVANKFGISVETILWENDLGPRSLIRPGDELVILPMTGVSHKVASGDTIGKIAKKYDISEEKIIEYNNLFDVSDIKVGQDLLIPEGRKVSPYVAPSTSYVRATPSSSGITKLFIPPQASASQTSGMVWPAGVRRISQYYSWRHTGLDIAGPTGTAIYAAEGGTVEYSGWSNGYGYNVLINHNNGYKTRYAHHSKLYVSKGDQVVKGQTIAAMGSTGWSTGPHLHFEVIVSGVKKNPLSYIK